MTRRLPGGLQIDRLSADHAARARRFADQLRHAQLAADERDTGIVSERPDPVARRHDAPVDERNFPQIAEHGAPERPLIASPRYCAAYGFGLTQPTCAPELTESN